MRQNKAQYFSFQIPAILGTLDLIELISSFILFLLKELFVTVLYHKSLISWFNQLGRLAERFPVT